MSGMHSDNSASKRTKRRSGNWTQLLPVIGATILVALVIFLQPDFTRLLGAHQTNSETTWQPKDQISGTPLATTESISTVSATQIEQSAATPTAVFSEPAAVLPSASPLATSGAPGATYSPKPAASNRPGEVGDNRGYETWDQISPEDQAILKSLYSQEELDLMFAPRLYVTLPNVVGMTEAEATATLHSIGVVGRRCYCDSHTGKYADGICYMQDVLPGERWHTDAQITIWIQKSDPTPKPSPTLAAPTLEPTDTPTPTDVPTLTPEPTPTPTPVPTEPTPVPTTVPTLEPTPTIAPTATRPS